MATNMTDNASQSDPSWDWYQSFLEVLRRGSLSAAARALRLTQPTIGRHIAAPEETLGGRTLFTRAQSGLLPTDVAFEIAPHAEAMAAAAASVRRSASAKA